MTSPTVSLIIPTLNASPYLGKLMPAIASQTLALKDIVIIDSNSKDDTVDAWSRFGAKVHVISPATFNHGGTRALASTLTDSDALIYMTQDAIPASPDTFELLYQGLYSEPDIGAAYGRQLPHDDADFLATQSRTFNYPAESRTKRLVDAKELGIKTCFSSDSFAIYRRTALEQVGGFPNDVIGSEDAYVAGKMLLQGWAVRYEALAQVKHSHNYTLTEEFKRYFDIGVFYGREHWIKENFGGAGGSGFSYVKAELQALLKAGLWWRIPESLSRTALKLFAYRLGKMEKKMPLGLKRRLSMFRFYWKD